MFTWICPKCGGEVPPAYNDCPRCNPPAPKNPPASATADTAEPPIPGREPAPPPPPPQRVDAPAPPPPVDAPSPPSRRAVVYAPPPEKRGISPTVVGLLAGLGIAALLGVLYLYVLPKQSSRDAAVAAPAALEKPGGPGSTARTHPLAKHLEVTGIRLRELKNGKATIQFVVVNHSAASLPEMTMDVVLRSADKTFFEIPAQLPSLGPYEVKDLSAAVTTELKSYELPDWQMIRPQFTLRSE